MLKAKGVSGSGTILGFAPVLEMTEQKSELSSGSVLALFSDGLMTAPVGGAAGFSRKDLFNTLKPANKTDVNAILSTVMDVWRKKNAAIRIEDDMCIVLGLIK
jgi:serine phosphatase RsbU (regulator of sigma subunit)